MVATHVKLLTWSDQYRLLTKCLLPVRPMSTVKLSGDK